jgi:histidyl-tRNA synthetase
MAALYKALQGFRDILPDEQPYWRFVEQTAVTVAELYGYRRIETPTLEETGVFLKTSGETSDVVEHQMYTFEDRPGKEGRGQSLTLRPEGTAGVVRAYLEHGMFKLPQPVKLYYFNEPMFRHERPQSGRYREHHQFGCEALGESDPALDAEIIALLYQIYTQLGLKGIRVQLNSIGDQQCRPRYVEALRAYYRPLLADCCQNCRTRFEKNPLRLLDCKEPEDQPKIAAAPRSLDYLCAACAAHFADVQRFLHLYEVAFELNARLVRGLDYYTRTVFEFTAQGEESALNGGGRYDGLAEILGGPATPGIGFGMGIERVILELKRQGITPPPVEAPRAFVIYLGQEPALKEAAVKLTAELRQAGLKAEMSYGDRSPRAQMRQADASGALYALILGEDELHGGFVTVRRLRATDQEPAARQLPVKREEILAYLQA